MDKIQKFLQKLAKEERSVILQILQNIRSLNIKQYDMKALKGYKNLFRIRKGKIRIIFTKTESHGIIVAISYRKDAYKL